MKKSDVQIMIDRIDEELSSAKNVGATFKKCVFHIHTPSSHDYGLNKKKDLETLDSQEIFSRMKEEGFPINLYKDNLEELIDLDKNKIFSDGKELAIYCMMAAKLVEKEIKLAVVTDHNTMDGVEKLIAATKINKEYMGYKISYCPKICWGVEVSCSDHHHVVAILDEYNKTMVKSMEDWLESKIISVKDGTYLPSLMVLNDFYEMGTIAYIAHFNTSHVFKEPKFLSGVYKKELFSMKKMSFLGLNNMSEINSIQERLSQYAKKKFHFVLDEDSHTLDKLGKKVMWIKGETEGFTMLKNALEDFDNSIRFSQVPTPNSYIKALYIQGKGFLSPNDKNIDIVLKFSDHMNAFIGGRGSGKSTILNTVEFLASQLVNNSSTLDNLLLQGNQCLLYELKGDSYYISLLSHDAENNALFTQQYFDRKDAYFENGRRTIDRQKRKVAIDKRIQVWRKINGVISEVGNKRNILDEIFTRKFSVTALVNDADDDQSIDNFLQSMLTGHSVLSNKIKINPSNSWKSINTQISNISNKLEEQKNRIVPILNVYNDKNKDFLRLTYKQNELKNYKFDWKEILLINKTNANKFFKGFSLNNASVLIYLEELSSIINPFQVIQMLHLGNYQKLEKILSIKKYVISNRKQIVDNDLLELRTADNLHNFFEKLKKIIDYSTSFVIDELKGFYKVVDVYGLDFNINNRTGVQSKKADFKPIFELSMGQKVVAMLNFILSFSEFINDFTPLIIDQPEDNLDNQYIYDNLVRIFKSLKNNRQIIIASHNSTIVLNSGTEQVYVMDSDAHNGWVSKSGFSRERTILKEIVNKLEGGTEAFEDKQNLYRNILKNNLHK